MRLKYHCLSVPEVSLIVCIDFASLCTPSLTGIRFQLVLVCTFTAASLALSSLNASGNEFEKVLHKSIDDILRLDIDLITSDLEQMRGLYGALT